VKKLLVPLLLFSLVSNTVFCVCLLSLWSNRAKKFRITVWCDVRKSWKNIESISPRARFSDDVCLSPGAKEIENEGDVCRRGEVITERVSLMRAQMPSRKVFFCFKARRKM
jgi:hypothetical protein